MAARAWFALGVQKPPTPRFRGEFELVRPLAGGGFGTVHLARQVGLGRPVVIKVMDPRLLDDAGARHRFEREARLTARIRHPAIVEVLAHDVEEGVPWIAYEYLEGGSLRDRLGRGPLPLSEALEVAAQVAGGLTAAHEAGVLHRDVKPENLLVAGPDRYKVADFGIARPLGDRSLETSPGMTLGTPYYMAPETIRGNPSTSSDIYALGLVLHEMLTGELPFDGREAGDILKWHLGGLREAGRLERARIAAGVRMLVMKAIAVDPAARYGSAAEMEAAIRAQLAALEGGSEPTRVVRVESRPPPDTYVNLWHIALPFLATLVIVITNFERRPAGGATSPSSAPASLPAPPTPGPIRAGGFDDPSAELHEALAIWNARKEKHASWRENPGKAEIINQEDLKTDRYCLDVVHALVKDYSDRLRKGIPLDDRQMLLYLQALAYGYNWSRSLLEQDGMFKLAAGMLQDPSLVIEIHPERVSSAEYLPAYREQLKETIRRLREGSPHLRRHYRAVLQTIWEVRRGFSYHDREARTNVVELKKLTECVNGLATTSGDSSDDALSRLMRWYLTSTRGMGEAARTVHADLSQLDSDFAP